MAQRAAGLNDDELMDMVSIISQLQMSEAAATPGAEQAELHDLVNRSMEVLKENGFVDPDIGRGSSTATGSRPAQQAAPAGAGAAGSGGSMEFVFPPSPPSTSIAKEGVKNLKRSAKQGGRKASGGAGRIAASHQALPHSFISAESATENSEDISSSDDDEIERPVRVGGSPGRAAVPAAMAPSTTARKNQAPAGKAPASCTALASGNQNKVSDEEYLSQFPAPSNPIPNPLPAPAPTPRERVLSADRRQMEEEVELQNALFMSMRQEPVHVPSAAAASQENIDLLVQMMEVTSERAERALMQNGHNIEAAINSLLSEES